MKVIKKPTPFDWFYKTDATADLYISVGFLDHLHRGGRIGMARVFLRTRMKIKSLLKHVHKDFLQVELRQLLRSHYADRYLHRTTSFMKGVETTSEKESFISDGTGMNSTNPSI